MTGNDPYKYFRIEAQELVEGLSQGILNLETSNAPTEVVHRLMRLAHTLKGAARVVRRPAIADRAHALEDLLSDIRQGHAQVTREGIQKQLELVDFIRTELTSLHPPSSGAPTPPKGFTPLASAPEPELAREAPAESVRVEVSHLDALLETTFELSAGIREYDRPTEELAGTLKDTALLLALLRRAKLDARVTAIAEGLHAKLVHLHDALLGVSHRVERELKHMAESAHSVRLVPLAPLFGSLERLVRDTAHSVDRLVAFSHEGGDVRVEGDVLAKLRDALPHVLRNAVIHGIEDARTRQSAQKPPTGRIHLRVERKGGTVTLTCSDDGRGIDRAAVRRAAILAGVQAAHVSKPLSEQEELELIFAPGVSTSEHVDGLAGRGVGMDVVRTAVRALRGEIRIHSVPGQGTQLELSVPVALSSVRALRVRAAGVLAAVPVSAVATTLRVETTALGLASDAPAVFYKDKRIPFVPLGPFLSDREVVQAPRTHWTVLLLRAHGRELALGVDVILGVDTVVLRPLPHWAGKMPGFSGAFFDADGIPRRVLDVAGFLAEALTRKTPLTECALPARPRVLVIDDSLTTRMLEQSILESAGYEVDIAESAEDGMSKAQQRSYGLFVVDCDMPGMNGFEFVTKTKATPRLQNIPAIMVTSRSSDDDKRRAFSAGVSAYVVKGEFDQTYLLATIRGLIG